eukprot:12605746-Alexandrium_andersonii.AAC.1
MPACFTARVPACLRVGVLNACALLHLCVRIRVRAPMRRGMPQCVQAVSYTHLTLPTICSV